MREFALVGISWKLGPFTPAAILGDPVTGSAIYRVKGSDHQMFGEFSIAGAEPTRFGSGLVPGADPPHINIVMNDDAQGCVNQAFQVHGIPVARALDDSHAEIGKELLTRDTSGSRWGGRGSRRRP